MIYKFIICYNFWWACERRSVGEGDRERNHLDSTSANCPEIHFQKIPSQLFWVLCGETVFGVKEIKKLNQSDQIHVIPFSRGRRQRRVSQPCSPCRRSHWRHLLASSSSFCSWTTTTLQLHRWRGWGFQLEASPAPRLSRNIHFRRD